MPAGPYTFLRAGRPDAGVYPVNALPQHFGKSRAAGMRFDGGSLPEHPDSLNLVGRDAAQGQMARDMTLFVDDDGRAYHVYSSEENSTLHISELTDDYLAHSGRYARFFVGRFMEAPALFKRGGRYYLMMSGCTAGPPTPPARPSPNRSGARGGSSETPAKAPEPRPPTIRRAPSVVAVAGTDRYIYMGDRWNPADAADGRYVWLPGAVRRRGIPRRMARPLALGRVTERKTNLPHMKQTYQPKKH